MSLESLSEIKEKLKSAFDDAKNILKESVVGAMQDIPHIIAIRVKQYTPGFNDGDPCRNTMCDLEVKLEGAPPDVGEDGDGWILGCYLDADDVPDMGKKDIELIKKKTRSLEDSICGLKDVFERTFETNTQITFYKTGAVEVEEYDCGH